MLPKSKEIGLHVLLNLHIYIDVSLLIQPAEMQTLNGFWFCDKQLMCGDSYTLCWYLHISSLYLFTKLEEGGTTCEQD